MSSIEKTANLLRQQELSTEIIRKSIHMMIALVPPLASLNLEVTLLMLGSGVLFYAWAEIQRLEGRNIGFVSFITVSASRSRDMNGIVFGPITLAMGAMIALMLYPEPAASLAIYALAFGDGLSSVVGKAFGRVRIPWSGGKTVIGSLTCFFVVFLLAIGTVPTLFAAASVAVVATVLEMLPSRDLDNIILPVGVGLFTYLLMI
ncbi:MAG: diacylglycerol/polyprenol kinase family protein [bacterium]